MVVVVVVVMMVMVMSILIITIVFFANGTTVLLHSHSQVILRNEQWQLFAVSSVHDSVLLQLPCFKRLVIPLHMYTFKFSYSSYCVGFNNTNFLLKSIVLAYIWS